MDDLTPDENEIIDRAIRTLDQMQHSLRLGIDAMKLLGRCYDECDMDPDLSVEVGTLLLRCVAHSEHLQRG